MKSLKPLFLIIIILFQVKLSYSQVSDSLLKELETASIKHEQSEQAIQSVSTEMQTEIFMVPKPSDYDEDSIIYSFKEPFTIHEKSRWIYNVHGKLFQKRSLIYQSKSESEMEKANDSSSESISIWNGKSMFSSTKWPYGKYHNDNKSQTHLLLNRNLFETVMKPHQRVYGMMRKTLTELFNQIINDEINLHVLEKRMMDNKELLYLCYTEKMIHDYPAGEKTEESINGELWLDKNINYQPVKFIRKSSFVDHKQETLFTNYQAFDQNKIYFPFTIEEKSIDPNGNLVGSHTVNFLTLEFNVSIPNEVFEIFEYVHTGDVIKDTRSSMPARNPITDENKVEIINTLFQ